MAAPRDLPYPGGGSLLCPALPAIVEHSEHRRRTPGAWMAESDAAGLPLGRWVITEKQSGQADRVGWQKGSRCGVMGTRGGWPRSRASGGARGLQPGVRGRAAGQSSCRGHGLSSGYGFVGETSKYYGLSLQAIDLKG